MQIQNIAALDQSYYMNTFGQRLPVMPVRGEGCTLYDADGKAYTDFLAGIAVNCLGYAHPTLTKAICEQAQTLMHCSNYFYIPKQAELAELLCKHSCADKVFFANSGGEANEAAIKLARAYFYYQDVPRYEIITATHSFHGRTLATVTATAQEKYQKPFAPLPEGFHYVPYGNINALAAAITPQTAAVMLEPIQGEGGVIEGGKDYLQAVRKLCDAQGVLLIFDEVQCGMGRTGTLFAHQLYEVEPDLFTLAKALGGGVPIGALLAKDRFCAFRPGDHGTTFGGNPLACAAGIAVIHELTAPGFLSSVRVKGALLKSNLQELQSRYPTRIEDVRGQGLMIGVALSSAIPVKTIQLQMLESGFITGTAGTNVIRLVPPLIIEEEQIHSFIKSFESCLKQYAQ